MIRRLIKRLLAVDAIIVVVTLALWIMSYTDPYVSNPNVTHWVDVVSSSGFLVLIFPHPPPKTGNGIGVWGWHYLGYQGLIDFYVFHAHFAVLVGTEVLAGILMFRAGYVDPRKFYGFPVRQEGCDLAGPPTPKLEAEA